MADLSLSHITVWLGILAGAAVLYVSLNILEGKEKPERT